MQRRKRLLTHMTINASAKMFHCKGFRATFLLLKLQRNTISTYQAISQHAAFQRDIYGSTFLSILIRLTSIILISERLSNLANAGWRIFICGTFLLSVPDPLCFFSYFHSRACIIRFYRLHASMKFSMFLMDCMVVFQGFAVLAEVACFCFKFNYTDFLSCLCLKQ